MELNLFILFLKCFDGIGDASIRKMINNNCFNNLKIESTEDVINWLKKNRIYFSKKFDSTNINVEMIKKVKDKRLAITSKLKEIGANFISYFDERYPQRFKEMINTNDYPVLLFYKGDISLLDSEKTCAIIGTREPSNKTIDFGNEIAYEMTKKGYVVVSGLALGCDTIGHKSCLKAGGKTVAILGTGIDVVYPKENKELAKEILESNGLLVTEEIVGFKGASYSFVNRDRLQASASDVVIALETSSTGGTMHASRDAVKKYNKILYVLSPEVLPDGDTSGNKELINYFGARTIKELKDLEQL